MSIAYFAHELADAAVQKRVRMLSLAGRDVTLLGFERERGGASASAHGGVVLGRTQNRRFLSRILSVVMAIPRALGQRQAWRDAELIIARNLEMLALVTVLTRLLNPRARIAYECLDIHAMVLGNGPASKMMRAVERACLKRAALIITSSPAFERNYFRGMQNYQGRVLIAENKVLTPSAAPDAAPASQAPWIIAWCGVLRCKRSFDLLRSLAAKGVVKVELWGVPALDQIPDFHEAVAASPGVRFNGAYAPADLPAIYASAHFSWAIDFYETGGNSDWLLPNRLYESLCYGATPIAFAGVETARWLEAHGVGVVLAAPIEQTADAFLAGLDGEARLKLQDAVMRLDPAATRLTAEGCRAFAAELAGAPV